jgi:hypothetical protein
MSLGRELPIHHREASIVHSFLVSSVTPMDIPLEVHQRESCIVPMEILKYDTHWNLFSLTHVQMSKACTMKVIIYRMALVITNICDVCNVCLVEAYLCHFFRQLKCNPIFFDVRNMGLKCIATTT